FGNSAEPAWSGRKPGDDRARGCIVEIEAARRRAQHIFDLVGSAGERERVGEQPLTLPALIQRFALANEQVAAKELIDEEVAGQLADVLIAAHRECLADG